MFIVTNDNSDGQLLHLQQQIDELRGEARIMRAEIERLKATTPAEPASDRKAYMREYMRQRRAGKRNASCDAGAGKKAQSL